MTKENTLSTDVIVVGGGMVGSLTAAALACCGVDVIVLEQKPPPAFDVQTHDLRVSAISVATERMFEAVDAWRFVQQMRVCPFRRMLVWDGDTEAKTDFNSASIGRPYLGHIVENSVLQIALWQRLQELENVRLLSPASIAGLQVDTGHATVQLDDGSNITTALVVAADGARSKVRELASIDVTGESYDQHALVATVTTELSQQDITWQRFTPAGPQAFLPLSDNRASMVWYQSAETIAELKSLSAEDFLDAMQSEFPARLGGLESLLGIGSFPLHWQHAVQYVKPRVALVGDAAHSVHPLAGQGVNMGMLDAAALVECVVSRYTRGNDIGGMRTLRSYERWRKGSNAMMIDMLDRIHHAFQPAEKPNDVVRMLRGVALNSADKIKPLNSICMKMAMGLSGDLPLLAKGSLPIPSQV